MLENYIKTDYKSYEDYLENFKVRVPENFNFSYDVVDSYGENQPEKLAMIWHNDEGETRTFNYGQLKKYSDKAANFFKALGIGKGDPVMLILKRRYEFWFCLLALHKLGAIAIPATHLLTSKDIVYRNNAADIKMIVSVFEEGIIGQVEEAEKDSPSLVTKVAVGGSKEGWIDFDRELERASENFERPLGQLATRNDDISLIYFTSGTTGHPKMVQHDFTYPLGHIQTAKYWQNVIPDGIHLTIADTGWAKAMWGKIYGQWIAGSAIFAYDFERFVPSKMLEVIEKFKITTFCAPPTMYRFLIREDLSKYDLSALEYCVVAGEPLNPEVYHQFYKATGVKLMEGYGQTELTIVLATFPWMEPKPGSMGRPSPVYDVDIIDEAGQSCGIGEEGQVIVRTHEGKPVGMFVGYYRDEDQTNRVWKDNIYYTGDMAWRDEDGYYWFVGRADDVIKSSGYRIGPFEVESALMEHPCVLECAITAVPDEIRGQVVKATVVLTKGYKACEDLKLELQDHVKRVTAPYKYPRIIEFVEELPKTISGKIRRVEIREQDNK